jgi:hypothetical protein
MKMKTFYLMLISLLLVGQIMKAQETMHSDTQMWISISNNTTFIPAKLISNVNLCDTMQLIWRKYIQEHPEIEVKYNLSSNSAKYGISFGFEIDKYNNVQNATPKKYYSEIQSICSSVFQGLFESINWKTSQKKMKKGKLQPVNTNINITIYISRNGLKHIAILDRSANDFILNCE